MHSPKHWSNIGPNHSSYWLDVVQIKHTCCRLRLQWLHQLLAPVIAIPLQHLWRHPEGANQDAISWHIVSFINTYKCLAYKPARITNDMIWAPGLRASDLLASQGPVIHITHSDQEHNYYNQDWFQNLLFLIRKCVLFIEQKYQDLSTEIRWVGTPWNMCCSKD